MKKYNVSAYVELIGNKTGTREIYIYQETDSAAFIKYFSNPNYHGFYFSCYPFESIENTKKFGLYYSPEIASFTIEGNGGGETEKTREQIHLRQIQKQPDKNIQRFYSALQRKLETIPGIQSSYYIGSHEYKNRYYLPTAKIIIPHNGHSKNIKGTWEEHCLNLYSRAE